MSEAINVHCPKCDAPESQLYSHTTPHGWTMLSCQRCRLEWPASKTEHFMALYGRRGSDAQRQAQREREGAQALVYLVTIAIIAFLGWMLVKVAWPALTTIIGG